MEANILSKNINDLMGSLTELNGKGS